MERGTRIATCEAAETGSRREIVRTQIVMAGTTAEKEKDRRGGRKGCCWQRTEVEVKSSQLSSRGENVFTQDQSGQGASHGNLRGWVERWLGDLLMGRQSQH